MNAMDRQRLIDKYGLNNPPDPNNEIASAALAGPSLVAKMFNWRSDIHQLWDPDQNPTMHAIATNAHRELRLGIGRCDVEVFDGHGNPTDPNDDDTALFVNLVGMPVVTIVRPGEYDDFARVYQTDWKPKLREGLAEHCRVRIAPACGFDECHRVEYWPWLHGRFLLLFMVCPACRDRATLAASDSQELIPHRMEALAAETPDPPWTQYEPPQDSGGGDGR
jgi:hypothetical protein